MKGPQKTAARLALVALATACFAVVLFVSAGTWQLPLCWGYLGVFAVILAVTVCFMQPDLMKERLRPGPGGRDAWIIVPAKLLMWAQVIIAGLDVGRFHWSGAIPPAVRVACLLIFGASLALSCRSVLVNRFYSSVVRLQSDRGHHVITDGPYRYVRHPGYLGTVLFCLSSPLALGSWAALLPMLATVVLLLRRTIIEDRFLHEHLEGYQAYAARVRYRLVPGLW